MFTMSVDKNKVDQNHSEDIDPSSNESSDGQLSELEKQKLIKYLQDHEYKVFTEEAYKTFLAQNKPMKEEMHPSYLPPPQYPPTMGYKYPSLESKPTTFIPKLSTFSGDPSRSDVPYEVWKFEVECLMREGYSECVILQSIRRSLRTQASKIAMRLGPDASLTEILDKMESIHGTVDRGESLLTQFYSATQQINEDTTSWGCRLEDLLSKAVDKGKVAHKDVDEMLRNKFWTGLKQDFKDISGYLYDNCSTFDELRKEIRLIEKEHPQEKKKTPHMNVAASLSETPPPSDEITELKAMIQKLTTKVETLENQKSTPMQSKQEQSTEGFATWYSRGRPRTRYRQKPQRNTRGRFSSYGQGRDNDYQGRDNYYRGRNDTYDQDEPICRRCKQPGHLAYGCRVNLEKLNTNLNDRGPVLEGRR